MLRVLAIDDSSLQRTFYHSVLEKQAIHVMSTACAKEGITLARSMQPDVILTEVALPGLSGFQATRLLKSEPLTRNIPVIIVSTKMREQEITWGLRQGAHFYLTKPVSDEQIMEHIFKVLPKNDINGIELDSLPAVKSRRG